MFLNAARLLARERPDVHFLLCGAGITAGNAELASLVTGANLDGRLHLLGLRSDVPRVTAALDIAACSSSYGESFALVLGEAMACEIPVVTTSLPGPASVVGEEGWIVPVGDAPAMVSAWRQMLAMSSAERTEHGRRARRRIIENFSVQRMVDRYEQLYTEVSGPERLRVSAAAR